MRSLLSQMEGVLRELQSMPNVQLSRTTVLANMSGESTSSCRDDARELGILLDDSLCSTWDQITALDVRWEARDVSRKASTWRAEPSRWGQLVVPDYFDFEEHHLAQDVIDNPGESDLIRPLRGEVTDPKEFMWALAPLWINDAHHFAAFRRANDSDGLEANKMGLWFRTPGIGRACIDLEMDADWHTYLERMLLCRGALCFELTLVPDESIPRSHRRSLATGLRRFCDAACLFDDPALNALVDVQVARAKRFQRT